MWATVSTTKTPTLATKCTITSDKKCNKRRAMVLMLSTCSGFSDSIRTSIKVCTI